MVLGDDNDKYNRAPSTLGCGDCRGAVLPPGKGSKSIEGWRLVEQVCEECAQLQLPAANPGRHAQPMQQVRQEVAGVGLASFLRMLRRYPPQAAL